MSLMLDADTFRTMVQTIGGSANGSIPVPPDAALHGDVRVPFGVVTTTPTLNAGKGLPTAAVVVGGVHCCTVSSVAGMESLSGVGGSPDAECWHSTISVVLSAVGDV